MKQNIWLFKGFFLFIILTQCIVVRAQEQVFSDDELSYYDDFTVSLLTCEPHSEVYSLYGHTALRVRNPKINMDIAVNYGVFDYTVDNFVIRFILGLTDYMMGAYDFSEFQKEYEFYGSAVYEQVINMNSREKRDFIIAMQENAKKENLVYRYNFLYNNCTTKARDIILDNLGGKIQFTPLTSLQKGKRTFRQLVHRQVEDYPWTRYGDDILLGVEADLNTTHSARQFLPDVLKNDFDSARIVYPDGTSKPLVASASVIIPHGTPHHEPLYQFPLSPTYCALIFFILIVVYVVATIAFNFQISYLNYIILILYAIPGLLLFCMLFSQHPTVRVNLQILIFNPLWVVIGLPRFHHHLVHGLPLTWIIVASCTLLFFIGNIFQSYAEGMNILALALLILAMRGIGKGRPSVGSSGRHIPST